jgi:hypothetical protein
MDKSGIGHGRRRLLHHGLKAITGLEGALSASKADSPLNGDAWGSMCPRRTGD